MRSYSARLMVLPSVTLGSSVTMNVDPALREVTRVWTLTLPNSLVRQVGISSVKAINSSGEGLSWIVLARMSRVSSSRGLGEASDSIGPGSALGVDSEVELHLGSVFDDPAVLHPGAGSHDLQLVDVADGLGRL